MWAIASAPMLLVLMVGVLTVILLTWRPANDRPIEGDVIRRQQHDPGPLTPREHAAGVAALAVLIGLVAGPYMKIDGGWFACLGAMVLTASGVLTREQFRSAIDWPLLIFLGVILGMPA
jgi:di/tricarboxylate transporter